MGNREWVAHPATCGDFTKYNGNDYKAVASGNTPDGTKTYTFTVPNGLVYELDYLMYGEFSSSPGGSATILADSTIDGVAWGHSLESSDRNNHNRTWPEAPWTGYDSAQMGDLSKYQLGRHPVVVIKNSFVFKVSFNFTYSQPTRHDIWLHGRFVKA